MTRHLHRGEAEAIILAEESHADFLLMDEKRGRSAARSRGVKVIGLLGVVLLAKKGGYIPSAGRLMAELESQAGFFVSDAVKQLILSAAGELPQPSD